MKWNNKSKKLLLDSLENKIYKFRIGSRCIYVPLTEEVCVKLYKVQQQRNRCVEFQKLAAKNSLAPKVGDIFTIKLLFVDHVCDIIKTYNMYGYLSQRVNLKRALSRRAAKELESKLLDIGINHYDIRLGNVGHLNGNLVCIDFDSNSCKKLNHFYKQT
jgi:hypothetical protein